jgi:hypothetical protein
MVSNPPRMSSRSHMTTQSSALYRSGMAVTAASPIRALNNGGFRDHPQLPNPVMAFGSAGPTPICLASKNLISDGYSKQ